MSGRVAPEAAGRAAREWHVRSRTVRLHRPVIAGILNVTPDSFSDGGDFFSSLDALRHASRMLEEGADLLDVGGQSTRPGGATQVPLEEELRRVVPLVQELAREHPSALISVDTVRAAVAEAALDAGAHIVNDVSGFRLDGGMGEICARYGAGVILMHSRGGVRDMASYDHAEYGEGVVEEVLRELRQGIKVALAAGVQPDRIVIDPGIGFSKRTRESIAVLSQLSRLVDLGYPVMVGVSRKRMIGEVSGVSNPRARVEGTLGVNVVALTRGARLFRVHDVAPNRRALDAAWSILEGVAQ